LAVAVSPETSRSLAFGHLHALIGGDCALAPDFRFLGLRSLESATPTDLSFLSSAHYRAQARATKAAAVLVRLQHRALLSPHTVAWIVDDPYLAYARASALWVTPREPWWDSTLRRGNPDEVGIRHAEPVCDGAVAHREVVLGPGVVLGQGVELGEGVSLGQGVVLGRGVVLGPGVNLGPGCSVGERACVGSGSRIGPGARIGTDVILGCEVELRAGVVVEHACRVGDRVRIHANTVLGADGFGFARSGEGRWIKIAQLGAVVVGDDVEIGALCSIDRGALDDTRIGRGSKLDNQIQVGHNVCIGEDCAIAGCVGIAGSTVLGNRVLVGGGAGILGHLRIADDVVIAAMSLISRSIAEPGLHGSSYPQMRNADWERSAAVVRQLPALRRRLIRVEATVSRVCSGVEAAAGAGENPGENLIE